MKCATLVHYNYMINYYCNLALHTLTITVIQPLLLGESQSLIFVKVWHPVTRMRANI